MPFFLNYIENIIGNGAFGDFPTLFLKIISNRGVKDNSVEERVKKLIATQYEYFAMK